MHQNEWFQVWFFKNFLGRGSPSPLPRPLPRFFSDFALGSGFALNSRALRALDLGFALDTRALRALDSGFARLSIGDLGLPPQNKFLDPPLKTYVWFWVCETSQQSLEIYEVWRHNSSTKYYETKWRRNSHKKKLYLLVYDVIRVIRQILLS